MEIPWRRLSESTLIGVIEDFILREGTDYGPREFTVQEKINQVRYQLESGKAKLVFEAASGTCNIIPAEAAIAAAK